MRWDVSKFAGTAFTQVKRSAIKSGTRDLFTRGVSAATAASRSVASTSTAQQAANLGATFGRNVFGFGSRQVGRAMPTARRAATVGREMFGYGARQVGVSSIGAGLAGASVAQAGLGVGKGAVGVVGKTFDWAGRHPYAALGIGVGTYGTYGVLRGMMDVSQGAAPQGTIGPGRAMGTGAGYNTWGAGSRERTSNNMGASGDLTLALGRMRHG